MGLPSNAYIEYAKQAASKYGVPVSILAGVLQKESGFDPSAINHNSNGTVDYGIAQLNTKYYPQAYTMTPAEQIDKAASILASNYKGKGNWYDALRAYNAGMRGSQNPTAAVSYADQVLGFAVDYGYNNSTSSPAEAAITGNQLDLSLDDAQKWIDGIQEQAGANTAVNPDNAVPGAPSTIGEGITGAIQKMFDDFKAWVENGWNSFIAWTKEMAIPSSVLIIGGIVVVAGVLYFMQPMAAEVLKHIPATKLAGVG